MPNSCNNGVDNFIILISLIFAMILMGTVDSLYDNLMGLEITNMPYYDVQGKELEKTKMKMYFYIMVVFICIVAFFVLNKIGRKCSLYPTICLLIAGVTSFQIAFLGSYHYRWLSSIRNKKSRLGISVIGLLILLRIMMCL